MSTPNPINEQSTVVQAVIALAELDPEQRRLIAAAWMPNHTDTVEELADLLAGIERCGWGDRAVLDDWGSYGGFTACAADQAQDELADSLAAEARVKAQLLASLIERRLVVVR